MKEREEIGGGEEEGGKRKRIPPPILVVCQPLFTYIMNIMNMNSI